MAAHVDAAGHRDERRAGHPVRRRRHAVEHRWDGTARDVVGIDLHRARQPPDRGVDENGERDEQDADDVGGHAHLLEDGHEADEDDEPARVQCRRSWAGCRRSSLALPWSSSPQSSSAMPHSRSILILGSREPEDQHHEHDQGPLRGHVETEREPEEARPVERIGEPMHDKREHEPDGERDPHQTAGTPPVRGLVTVHLQSSLCDDAAGISARTPFRLLPVECTPVIHERPHVRRPSPARRRRVQEAAHGFLRHLAGDRRSGEPSHHSKAAPSVARVQITPVAGACTLRAEILRTSSSSSSLMLLLTGIPHLIQSIPRMIRRIGQFIDFNQFPA